MVELKGDWIGYYTYNKGYSESQRQQRIPFRLTIERGINEFIGRIFEEVEFGGIDDEILIKVRQNGDEIEFTKYYSSEHFFDENGEPASQESDNSNTVYYNGKFDNLDKRFKGDWQIPGLREDEAGVFHADNFTGHWLIWREA